MWETSPGMAHGVGASGKPACLTLFPGRPPGPKVPDSWSLLCPSCSINGHVFLRDPDSTFLSLCLLPVLLHPSAVLMALGTSSFIRTVLPTPSAITLTQAPRHLVLGFPSLQSTPDTTTKQSFKHGSDHTILLLRHLPWLPIANIKDNWHSRCSEPSETGHQVFSLATLFSHALCFSALRHTTASAQITCRLCCPTSAR